MEPVSGSFAYNEHAYFTLCRESKITESVSGGLGTVARSSIGARVAVIALVQIVGRPPDLRLVPVQLQLLLAVRRAPLQRGVILCEAIGAGVEQAAVAADHARVTLDAGRPVVRRRRGLRGRGRGHAQRRQQQRGAPASRPGFSVRMACMQPHESNLVWIDLEMTGLDTLADAILEIATLVTDKHLENLVEGPAIAVYQPEQVLAGMDRWNKDHHTASGLIKEVRASRVSCAEAERRTLDFLKRHALRGQSPMCGNSICQDRRFLARLMPELESFFHYRNLDVSTLKELAKRWKPAIVERNDDNSRHRGLSDVHGSIEELRHYRRNFLRLGSA